MKLLEQKTSITSPSPIPPRPKNALATLKKFNDPKLKPHQLLE